MRIFGCITCGSAWAASPATEPDGSHYSDSQVPCSGTAVPFLPEAMVGANASAVLCAQATRDAAIWRCEAIASQAQRLIWEWFQSDRAAGRAVVRAYRAVLRAEQAEGVLEASRSFPAATMRLLIASERLLRALSHRRPCPSCRGGLDHRPSCRLQRLLDRVWLLTSARHAPHKIRRSRRRMQRGA